MVKHKMEVYMDSNEDSYGSISLIDIYHIIVSKIKVVFLVTLFSTLLFSTYAWFIASPKYRSNADVMVQIQQISNANDLNFDYANAFRLIDTVAELMEKEVVYVVAIIL
jgi:capsular polysaccharide biosynthesis protein